MPTGYTDSVIKGECVDFQEFALACARNFGALIMMRDEPRDAEIPDEFQPNTSYYDESEAKARATLAFLESASPEEIAAKVDASNADRLAYREKYLAEARLAEERCDAMLEKVYAWTPPTEEHGNLKKFMIDQLEDTRRYDGVGGYTPDATPLSVEEWVEAERSKAEDSITYAIEKRAAEIDRTAERNAWVRVLRESLAGASA